MAVISSRTVLRGIPVPKRLSPSTVLPQFKVTQRIATLVREASDVAGLPDGRFLVVSDKSDELSVVDAKGRVAAFKLPKLKNGKSQLEGVAFDAKRNHLFVAREEKGQVLRYAWDPAKDKAPKFEKKFKFTFDGGWGNKGFEGLTFLPGALSPDGKAHLLAAKEGKPRRLYLLDCDGGGQPKEVKLDSVLRDVAKDFSAIATDPKTGHVYLASDASSVVVQLELKKKGGDMRADVLQTFALTDFNGGALARIEGLAFNPQGDLHVLTENDGVLHTLKRSAR